MSFSDAPVLSNQFVQLHPLSRRHSDELAAAVSVDELWKTWYTPIPSPDGMSEEIERRLRLRDQGRFTPWVVVNPVDGSAVGMTSYINLDEPNRRLEIGATWIGRSFQGTAINPAAKLLLLERAFGELGCLAVEFRTHWHNRQSRAAIERLGAKQDGVLRNFGVHANGVVRDMVLYSIIESEWPLVRHGLVERLARHERVAVMP